MSSLRDEFAVLSKPKPDNALNLFKVAFANEKLAEANQILTGDYKPFSSFDQFDTERLPSNSDVLLVVSQYLACLERWRSAHVRHNELHNTWHWRVEDEDIEAYPPTRSRG